MNMRLPDSKFPGILWIVFLLSFTGIHLLTAGTSSPNLSILTSGCMGHRISLRSEAKINFDDW